MTEAWENLRRMIGRLCILVVLVAWVGPSLFAADEAFRFTAVSDIRYRHDRYGQLLYAMVDQLGGEGAFQVGVGDLDDRIWENRATVDWVLGHEAIWFPGIGNHEAEDPVEMDWLRDEYTIGNDIREPLRLLTNQDGPTGSESTTYSWECGDAHFVYLNEYWNGDVEEGSDIAADGDIVPELLAWLEANLRANTRPVVFVMGHEPAFPFHRHLHDSLNKYPENRDAFWSLLERSGVIAYLCGHTHVFSVYRHERGNVWQIDIGNAGADTSFQDGQTFLDVTVTARSVRFDIWRNETGSFQLTHSWSQRVPIVFRDGFESGDLFRWE